MTGSAKQSIAPRKGRMDCRVASLLAMTVPIYDLAIPRRDAPGLCMKAPSKKRERGMPDARCTRGLVCKIVQRKRTRAYRFSGGDPAFPAQWLYGLCRALPGERIRLVTVAAGLTALPIRLDRTHHRQLGTSNGCRDHTVLPYAESAVRPARCCSLATDRPVNKPARPTLPRPPHPIPTFVTMANAPHKG
ncbi:hypothetical protein V1289_004488 [Bradyrhizobium sp. AZCC 2289]